MRVETRLDKGKILDLREAGIELPYHYSAPSSRQITLHLGTSISPMEKLEVTPSKTLRRQFSRILILEHP